MVKKKLCDTCIAFYLAENGVLTAYDERTSKEMINEINKRLQAEASRAEANRVEANRAEAAPKPSAEQSGAPAPEKNTGR